MLVVLVGQPNSGKSALLAKLTGARVVSSNYPGTTVELASGRIPGSEITILDTPGIYSLHALTREQEVTRGVLEGGEPDLIVNVVDGTSLSRHLALTLSLLSYGLPVVIAVNYVDELCGRGLKVDVQRLSEIAGCPSVLVSALTGEGVPLLVSVIKTEVEVAKPRTRVDRFPGETRPLPRGFEPSLRELQLRAQAIAGAVVRHEAPPPAGSVKRRSVAGLGSRLQRLLDQPLTGVPLLMAGLVLAWKAMAWALPFSEAAVNGLLAPFRRLLESSLAALLPNVPFAETLSRAVPEGLALPMSTVLPAMVLAYSMMAVLEDTGLLARYAALGDPVMGALRLPGQALIPFMLGFGCRVPGILASRTLPSPESRRTASLVLACLVPCTATVSLAWVTLAKFRGYPLVPVFAVTASTLVLARTMSAATGNSRDPLVLELPPLRRPTLRNVALKTEMRLSGFFSHVLPLVVAMNVALRLYMDGGRVFGTKLLGSLAEKVFGLPLEALLGIMFTMFQRYLAPLFLLQLDLTPRQATIAVTMVVLGFPCLPSTVALWREQGPGAVILAFGASVCLSASFGAVLNAVLP